MEEGVAGDLLSFNEELHRLQQIAYTVQRGCNKKRKKINRIVHFLIAKSFSLGMLCDGFSESWQSGWTDCNSACHAFTLCG